MRVEIREDALLAGNQYDTMLLGILAFALINRHRIILDAYPGILDVWEPTKSSRRLRDEVELAIDLSVQADAEGVPALHTIIVDDVGTPNWSAPPVLPPEHALMLLARPFRVLLENGRNDGNFLLAHCTESERESLKDAERKGWLEWVDTSGITGLHAMIEEEDHGDADNDERAHESTWIRIFALCDSDAQSPEQPSEQALRVRAQIERHSAKPFMRSTTFGHVLSARAAENYAAPARVLAWVREQWRSGQSQCSKLIDQTSTPSGRTALAARPPNTSNEQLLLRAIAWQRLRPEQRRHIDAKHGLDSAHNDAVLFEDLEPFDRMALRQGFGDSFSKRFYRFQHQHPDPTEEITTIIRTILGRL